MENGSGSTQLTQEIQKEIPSNENTAMEPVKEEFEESMRGGKADKYVKDAACRVKEAEEVYVEEIHRPEEIEDVISVTKKEQENMTYQLVKLRKERNSALWEKSLLEIKMADLEKSVDQYKDKFISAVELLQTFKHRQDDLELELDRARIANENLIRVQTASSNLISNLPLLFSEVSYSDIKDATLGFHSSLKIGEDGNHNIYRGFMRGTEVSIKMFYADNSQGSSEYHQEVEVLSRIRHPNIVSLIGVCPEAFAIVYEYLPNGSLEDRLSCKGSSPPLSWQARVRIAAELCSALVFLHLAKPHSIVHCDLKPSNILLDANFISKISNFGTCHVISPPDPLNGVSSARRILPKGTYAYFDPELRSEVDPEPNPRLDVYSFGIILLKLLTDREPWGIANEVRRAVFNSNLNSLLDSSAGEWPYIHTRQLIHIALKCADEAGKNRPCLESEVLKVLESFRASCPGIPLSPQLDVERHPQAPSYYICPISQDIMQDPYVAADGFTYELEGIQGWLLSGHDTSPMTNLKLDHKSLVPNRALRSAIQEWLKQT